MMAVMPLKCIIVEDQKMFAELLVVLLRAAPGMALDIVATVDSVAAGIRACDQTPSDILLLDIELGDGSGLEVAEYFQSVNPLGRIIVLSGHASTFVCPRSLSGTIVAVIDKSDAFQKLQTVLQSLRTIPGWSGSTSETVPRNLQLALSPREREVLLLVGQGRTSGQIASLLGISTHTVHVHRKKIAAKMGTRGSELRLRAYRYWQDIEGSTAIADNTAS